MGQVVEPCVGHNQGIGVFVRIAISPATFFILSTGRLFNLILSLTQNSYLHKKVTKRLVAKYKIKSEQWSEQISTQEYSRKSLIIWVVGVPSGVEVHPTHLLFSILVSPSFEIKFKGKSKIVKNIKVKISSHVKVFKNYFKNLLFIQPKSHSNSIKKCAHTSGLGSFKGQLEESRG